MADSYFAGLELGEKEVRLCVYDPNERDAVSVMVTAGGSRAECPAHMTYVEETGQWKYGIEADYFAQRRDCVLLDDILNTALSGRGFEVNGKLFPCETVLAEMFRQALAFAGIRAPALQLRALMVTVPKITKQLTVVIDLAFKRMGLASNQAFLQNYDESFYCHTFYQKPEVYNKSVGLFYFTDDVNVQFKRLCTDQSVRPATVEVTEDIRTALSIDAKKRDEQFCDFINEYVKSSEYSSFFLVGKGFDRSWSKNSLGLLCRAQRKVFYGSNLFSKGACYGAKEQSSLAQLKKTSLFLSSDLVRKNIGIELISEGIAVYHPLIKAGIHWYEAENECDVILNDEKNIVFRVSRMEDGKPVKYSMPLQGLPERPAKTTRVNIKVRFETADRCIISVKDMGFGELFPSSGMIWKEIL